MINLADNKALRNMENLRTRIVKFGQLFQNSCALVILGEVESMDFFDELQEGIPSKPLIIPCNNYDDCIATMHSLLQSHSTEKQKYLSELEKRVAFLNFRNFYQVLRESTKESLTSLCEMLPLNPSDTIVRAFPTIKALATSTLYDLKNKSSMSHDRASKLIEFFAEDKPTDP